MVQNLTNMANANGMAPMYTNGGSLCHRVTTAQQYPQIDTKSVYPTFWTVPPYEETSPVETYQIDQSPMYLPDPTPMSSTTLCGSSPYRWSHPITRHPYRGPTTYTDQEPAYSTSGLQMSPLSNMTSLQLSLPERPHIRQSSGSDCIATQRLLPVPQPSPAQNSRNAVDHLQNQRLRSSASATECKPSFARSSLPWGTEVDGQANISEPTPTDSTALGITSDGLPHTTDETLSYLPTPNSESGNTSATSTASQMHLNFSNPSLLDAMNASAPSTTYSNFRESYRAPSSSSVSMERQGSHSNMYSFDSDRAAKRSSLDNEPSSDYALVNGHTYKPLGQSQSHSSPGKNTMSRESCLNRHAPIHRASTSNLSNSF